MANVGLSRRAVLVGGAVVAGSLSGCLPGSEDEPAEPSPQVAQRLSATQRAIEDAQDLAARYEAVQLRFPDPTGLLVLLGAEHEAHANALRTTLPSRGVVGSGGAPARSTTPSHHSSPDATSREEALTELIVAEQSASRRRAEDATDERPRLARLLASIGACNAVHAALLEAALA